MCECVGVLVSVCVWEKKEQEMQRPVSYAIRIFLIIAKSSKIAVRMRYSGEAVSRTGVLDFFFILTQNCSECKKKVATKKTLAFFETGGKIAQNNLILKTRG